MESKAQTKNCFKKESKPKYIREYSSEYLESKIPKNNKISLEKVPLLKYAIINWEDLLVGDLVLITRDNPIPADLLLLQSSRKSQIAFVETKNLDGETNLKSKFTPSFFSKLLTSDEIIIPKEESIALLKKLNDKNLNVSYEPPNEYLNSFSGNCLMDDIIQKLPLDANNILLRGSILRNTDYIMGLVLYSGVNTKIMRNLGRAKPKLSTLEKKLYNYVHIVFAFLIILCFTSSLNNLLWIKNNANSAPYMYLGNENKIEMFFSRVGNWILILSNLVPISLIISVEGVKVFQAKILGKDSNFKSNADEEGCRVHTSNLIEEMGQIDTIFSDKTGTLTKNEMKFRKLVIFENIYGNDKSTEGKYGLKKRK